MSQRGAVACQQLLPQGVLSWLPRPPVDTSRTQGSRTQPPQMAFVQELMKLESPGPLGGGAHTRPR